MNDKVFSGGLTVKPNSLQHFDGDDVSLSCEAKNWPVRRNTSKENSSECGAEWGKADNSSCHMTDISEWEGGVYWCDGAWSLPVNITVTNGQVILESPVAPVTAGNNVTLRCRTKTAEPPRAADFYKDGRLLGGGASGHMTLRQVSRCDEGLYRCTVSGHGESPSSWIYVTDGRLLGGGASGHMTLRQVSRCDEGLYRCTVSGHGESPSSWIYVTEKPSTASPPTSQSPDLSSLSLSAFPPVGFLVLLGFFVFFVCFVFLVVLVRWSCRRRPADFCPESNAAAGQSDFSATNDANDVNYGPIFFREISPKRKKDTDPASNEVIYGEILFRDQRGGNEQGTEGKY